MTFLGDFEPKKFLRCPWRRKNTKTCLFGSKNWPKPQYSAPPNFRRLAGGHHCLLPQNFKSLSSDGLGIVVNNTLEALRNFFNEVVLKEIVPADIFPVFMAERFLNYLKRT